MKLIKTICSGLLAVLIGLSSCPAVCFAEGDLVKGQILMEDGSPAVGIKVDILSSEIDAVLDEDITLFANDYYTSIITDENGTYSFTKPSDYCVVEVVLDTLPPKTGIDNVMAFLYPGETMGTFTVYDIDHVELFNENSVNIFNSKGDYISAECSVEHKIEKSACNFLEIFDLEEIKKTHNVNANGFIAEFTTADDLSGYTMIEKTDCLRDLGWIGKKTKVSAYLYAIVNDGLGDIECATYIYDELYSYAEEHENTLLARQISKVTDYFDNYDYGSFGEFADNKAPVVEWDGKTELEQGKYYYTTKPVTINSDFTIPENTALQIENPLRISNGAELKVNGSLLVDNGRTLNIKRGGALSVEEGGFLDCYGKLAVSAGGELNVCSLGKAAVNKSGNLNIKGKVNIYDNGSLKNYGSFKKYSSAKIFGEITVPEEVKAP